MHRLIAPEVFYGLCDNDRALASQLLDMFLRTFAEDLASLEHAIAGNNRPGTSRLAHKMAGSVLLFGATPTADRLRLISRQLSDGGAEIAHGDYEALHIDLVQILVEVRTIGR